jgi:hypothetical protein
MRLSGRIGAAKGPKAAVGSSLRPRNIHYFFSYAIAILANLLQAKRFSGHKLTLNAGAGTPS